MWKKCVGKMCWLSYGEGLKVVYATVDVNETNMLTFGFFWLMLVLKL